MLRGYVEGMVATVQLFIAALALVSFAAGALAMWGLPKLWAWLMPIIHMATA